MEVKYQPTIRFKDLNKAYQYNFGKDISCEDFGWEDYFNNSYKEYSLDRAFDPDATEFDKNVTYLFLKEGVKIDETVLIDVSW